VSGALQRRPVPGDAMTTPEPLRSAADAAAWRGWRWHAPSATWRRVCWAQEWRHCRAVLDALCPGGEGKVLPRASAPTAGPDPSTEAR
jgi:hypothetical protein